MDHVTIEEKIEILLKQAKAYMYIAMTLEKNGIGHWYQLNQSKKCLEMLKEYKKLLDNLNAA